jgi:hypothetical protein
MLSIGAFLYMSELASVWNVFTKLIISLLYAPTFFLVGRYVLSISDKPVEVL